jgi:hypothetical protein
MEDPRRQWTPRPRFVLHEGPQVRTQDEQKPIMSFWYQGIDILAGILSTAKEIVCIHRLALIAATNYVIEGYSGISGRGDP